MQKIPLQLARAGMVLAREVFRNDSPGGNPVCGKNIVLTDSLINRLEAMEVKSVYIKGQPLRQPGDPTLDDMLRDLDLRFEKVRQDPLMSRLHGMYADYLKRTMGDDGGRQED
jgi:hypothetical protein